MRRLEICFPLISFAGLCGLCFLVGIVSGYYRLGPARFVDNAFEAADVWYKVWGDSRKPAPPQLNPNPKIAYQVSGDTKNAFPGYTLFSLRYSTTAFLVDMSGKLVYRWTLPFSKLWANPGYLHRLVRARIFIETAHIYPNGDLLVQYAGQGDTPYGYGIAKLDKDSNVLWVYNGNAHHDFYIDEKSGNIYALIHSIVNEPIPGLEFMHYPLLADYVVVLSPDGQEIDRISIIEAIHHSPYLGILHQTYSSTTKTWDVPHSNSIMMLDPSLAPKFPMFKSGDILISMRNFNALAVIDPVTRSVKWARSNLWLSQHAARFLPTGDILVFDNRRPRDIRRNIYSRLLTFNPETMHISRYFDGEGKKFYSDGYGRNQYLPNGNILVAESLRGRILEVMPDNRIAWKFMLTSNTPFRKMDIVTATRYLESQLPFLKSVPRTADRP